MLQICAKIRWKFPRLDRSPLPSPPPPDGVATLAPEETTVVDFNDTTCACVPGAS